MAASMSAYRSLPNVYVVIVPLPTSTVRGGVTGNGFGGLAAPAVGVDQAHPDPDRERYAEHHEQGPAQPLQRVAQQVLLRSTRPSI